MNGFEELAAAADATIIVLAMEREWKRKAFADFSNSYQQCQRVINAKNLHDLHMEILFHQARRTVFTLFARRHVQSIAG